MLSPVEMSYETIKNMWLLGVTISLVGTSMTALGLVLQKFSHAKNALCQEATVYYRQPWWLLGFSIFLAGQIVNVAAMPLAPQAMLSCLGAWALIFNALFAWAFLGEHISSGELFSIGGMVAGAAAVIMSTPTSNSFANGNFTTMDIAGPFFQGVFVCVSAGIAFFLTLFRITVHYMPDLKPVLLALCSAIASGYTVSLFKCVSILILSWSSAEPWKRWQFYGVLLVALGLCLVQVHSLNMALQLGRAMNVVPTLFAFSLLAQIGVAHAAYQEMRGMDGRHAATFVVGIVVMLSSVVGLVRSKITDEIVIVADDDSGELEKDQAPMERVPLLKIGDSKSLPARTWSLDSKDPTATVPPFIRRPFTEDLTSSLDYEAFRSSFEGRDRAYTLSVTGPLGLA
jgi:hypothetical protein